MSPQSLKIRSLADFMKDTKPLDIEVSETKKIVIIMFIKLLEIFSVYSVHMSCV